MVGLEALSLQGLPIDELLLTRETEDNLADLAGNAMSTTVVGTCILASLVLAKKLLPPGDGDDKMQVDEEDTKSGILDVEDHITGEGDLVEHPLDLSTTKKSSLAEILHTAERSARLCECEGRKGITDRLLQRCEDCGSSSCIKCGGRPEHNMVPISFDGEGASRLQPAAFEKDLKSTLPMCLTVTSVTKELLDDLWSKSQPDDKMDDDETSLWSKWRDAVVKASATEFRFIEPRRQEVWMAVYESTMGSLELTLHPKQPEWRLYAKADETEPANSKIRKVLESGPVARFICDKKDQSKLRTAGGLLEGRWDFALPLDTHVDVSIKGIGEDDDMVPAWEQRLGLTATEYKDRLVYAQLEVTVPEEDRSAFDRDISGVYTLYDKCGTANNALHKRQAKLGEEEMPPLFLLLDPSRCGDPQEDSFVFSISKRRYEFGESRPIVSRLNPEWRQEWKLRKAFDEDGKEVKQPKVEERKKSVCHIPFKWVQTQDVKFQVRFKSHIRDSVSPHYSQPSHGKDASFASPGDTFQVNASTSGCVSANALLVCRIPLQDQAGPEWPRGSWREVDKVHERGTYKALAWLLERIRTVDDHFAEWQSATLPEDSHNHLEERCERCAPTPPTIRWRKVGAKISAIEDTVGAGEYERSLKRRPTPFVTQLKLEEESGMGTVRIGINVPSLLHRAVSRLPVIKGNGRLEKKPVLSWRLHTDFTPAAKINFQKFDLQSNKHDEEHKDPPNFKIPLRPEQRRSLHWMIKQEELKDAVPFFEEEISEAIMAPLGWRAEGRARREILIRGGVLADQVGYGKTAITLGLLDCTQTRIEKELAKKVEKEGEDFIKGKIPVKASLIIVPPHLTGQWASEVKKFTGKRFQVEVLSTATSLNALTIERVQDADMVIVASNLFSSTVYLDNLQTISGGGTLPTQDGRYFGARLDQCLDSLKSQVEILRDDGSVALMKEIKAGRRKRE